MMDKIRRLTTEAMLLALAVVIHTIEAVIPVTVGWFRFGFANIVGVATLYLLGFRSAMFVTVGRIFLGSLISGQLGGPGFVLALSGGILSMGGMGLAYWVAGRFLSPVGISVIGALLHNAGQIAAACFVIIRNDAVLFLLPVMMAAGLITGVINGLAARYFIARFLQSGPGFGADSTDRHRRL
jgi:heptaprenyl diphosphate synthase